MRKMIDFIWNAEPVVILGGLVTIAAGLLQAFGEEMATYVETPLTVIVVLGGLAGIRAATNSNRTVQRVKAGVKGGMTRARL